MQKTNRLTVVENKLENGIMIGKFKKGNIIDLHTAMRMVEERLQFQNGNEYPIVIHLNGIKFASSEARNYMKREGIKGIKAGAFIISNPVERIILNFLLLVSPPEVPAKMFTSEKEAFDWIQQYK